MTDHKFTDDDVIKALEELKHMAECSPPICHYEKGIIEPPHCKPYEQFQKDAKIALALINRQKAEIERLNKCIKTEDEVREIMKSQMLPMVREITVAQIDRAKEIGRIEAIKEFAERLKPKLSYYDWIYVDTLVKEMTEGEK